MASRSPLTGVFPSQTFNATMKHVPFNEAETYQPEAGWRRVSLAGSESFSFEWFEKPPGHASPMHDHANEQVCLCLDGTLVVETEDRLVTLGAYDSVWLDAWEAHKVLNPGEDIAIGLDVFSPGRSFDFWTDRSAD